ncbi:dienelactone hydrolase family protein [Geotalea uraniireducens]|uniref:Dienelactone hydrolase n=1 Tax=Geotalea uraniireducens (strain Rf4) TaxID=351605 RepID=A5GB73_GEOUR|nr:dienelactone hydrolase family protein [Geotalea uraniireducens]ABQ25170.1 dienelactone hydrolase [Geotalea uraniireducens Rf4]
MEKPVRIEIEAVTLEGVLGLPEQAKGVVIFAHGSGSSRLSPRNTYVARLLQGAGIGTLLFDLLTSEEDRIYEQRFDIGLLARRLAGATQWLAARPELKGMALGYFGASTGAAAALQGAAQLGSAISAVVSRGGRPDLAMPYLPKVLAPTLLIVGELDVEVLQLNRQAFAKLAGEKELAVVPGATHLFEEPGTLEQAAKLAQNWFSRHLG